MNRSKLAVDTDLFSPACNLLYYVCEAALTHCPQVSFRWFLLGPEGTELRFRLHYLFLFFCFVRLIMQDQFEPVLFKVYISLVGFFHT